MLEYVWALLMVLGIVVALYTVHNEMTKRAPARDKEQRRAREVGSLANKNPRGEEVRRWLGAQQEVANYTRSPPRRQQVGQLREGELNAENAPTGGGAPSISGDGGVPQEEQ